MGLRPPRAPGSCCLAVSPAATEPGRSDLRPAPPSLSPASPGTATPSSSPAFGVKSGTKPHVTDACISVSQTHVYTRVAITPEVSNTVVTSKRFFVPPGCCSGVCFLGGKNTQHETHSPDKYLRARYGAVNQDAGAHSPCRSDALRPLVTTPVTSPETHESPTIVCLPDSDSELPREYWSFSNGLTP